MPAIHSHFVPWADGVDLWETAPVAEAASGGVSPGGHGSSGFQAGGSVRIRFRRLAGLA